MRIFYDTEFIEDGRHIDLISIGMVREDDGAELYLVNRAMPEKKIRRNHWLMENVVPGLPQPRGDRRRTMPVKWLFDWTDPLAQYPDEIAARVHRFITDTPDPQLWAWYAAYDHVTLCQLFGDMNGLPPGIPKWTNDLRQECARLGNPRLPGQHGGQHNALADARHNLVRAQFLDELNASRAS